VARVLDGDRYANLTLIEAEVLDELTLPDGQRLRYAEARRNIVTRGIDLNTLVGQRFRSAMWNASGAGSVSPAPTWSDSPTRACYAT
jgi:hypothetical protein